MMKIPRNAPTHYVFSKHINTVIKYSKLNKKYGIMNMIKNTCRADGIFLKTIVLVLR